MRKDQVLGVRSAQLVEAVAFREIGDGFHLFGGDVSADADQVAAQGQVID